MKLRSALIAEELDRLQIDVPRLERGAADARALGATTTADVMEREAAVMRRRITVLDLALARQIAAEDQQPTATPQPAIPDDPPDIMAALLKTPPVPAREKATRKATTKGKKRKAR